MESGCTRHRKSSESGKKNTFPGYFLVFFGVRGPFGSRRVSGTEKSAKNGLDFVWNFARFRVVSALCGVFLRVFFWCVFRSAHFAHFGRFGGPKVAKREVFGDHFYAIWVAGPTCENRRFTCTAAQFRGSRRVLKSSLFETFFVMGKKCPPGRHFCGFFSFLGAPGGPNGGPFWLKNTFLGDGKMCEKRSKSFQ